MATSSTAIPESINDEESVKEISKLANEYGSEFVNVFYKTLDTKRHELLKYYDDDCKLVWGGNEIEPANRQKFQTELPDTTHNVECFDVQPIFNEFNKSGHYMILVSVSGSVRCKGHAGWKLFYESFMLKAFDAKWKIVTDCYRFAE